MAKLDGNMKFFSTEKILLFASNLDTRRLDFINKKIKKLRSLKRLQNNLKSDLDSQICGLSWEVGWVGGFFYSFAL